MTIQLNHTIVHTRDAVASAQFLAEILGLGSPRRFGPFLVVATDNGVSLDFLETRADVGIEHYAFLVGDAEFDAIFGRLQARGLAHYADPGTQRRGEINHNDGGRGMYFREPAGHLLEVITRPYGSGG
jgi:catechol 2,3-dioxygenase-like lactoylglutathione lyase family enzyme